MAGTGRGGSRRDKNDNLFAALRHPLRRRILRRMSDGRKASPRELAEELGERLSNVAYHMGVLVECGVLKPSGEKPVRGSTKHFYRWSVDADWVQSVLDEEEDVPL